MSDSGTPLARELAAFAAGLDAAAVPVEVLERAKLNVLDAVGIGLAASTYDFADTTARGLSAIGEPGDSPLLGRAERLNLRDAMLLNGVLVHGLDFDDTHGDSVCHCSASALPLVLGVGHARGTAGREALAAYVLALELDARIGRVARGTLQKRGWHPTGVVGAFGCAAAAGRLLGADAPQIAHALGITLSMASGNLEFLADGAWTKRLHPGWAAVSGHTAASLARAGFLGPSLPFEGRFGLYRMLLGADVAIDRDEILAELGTRWAVFDNAFKPFPACHFLHAFIDCALALRADACFAAGFDAAAIAQIEAPIHPDEIAIVCEPQDAKRGPRNAYDAQFSLYYAVAAALMRGRFGLAELDEAALSDPAIRALAARVRYRPDPDSAYPQSYSGALEIRLRDGRRLAHREQVNRGAAGNPLAPAKILAKYRDNATRAVSAARATRLYDAVMALDRAPDLHAFAALVRAEEGRR
ncbi:MAG TPA: MmgE/PrpD family protein [Gammaproteobacteria bacterium]|nr:MmgE/PrpD family protein [Gammaproteobacteria bacterium]